MYNILDGITEKEDVILRRWSTDNPPTVGKDEGFLLLPDLNWDRRTVGTLHLLALVERRDICSVRDLRQSHVVWLKHMREHILSATMQKYGLEEDQLKVYIHYQPTYYHFHIHVVHVELEATSTQAVGKAIGLEDVIGRLEMMREDDDGEEKGMADVTLRYTVGEEGELWREVWGKLKTGGEPSFGEG